VVAEAQIDRRLYWFRDPSLAVIGIDADTLLVLPREGNPTLWTR
jgi:hypothetical protein